MNRALENNRILLKKLEDGSDEQGWISKDPEGYVISQEMKYEVIFHEDGTFEVIYATTDNNA